MNKLNVFCLINCLLLCSLTSRAEQDAALSKTNAPPIVVTNLVTAINATHELQNLWPSHDGEYLMAVRQILGIFSQHEDNPNVQMAVRKLFDDVIALQTVYGGPEDYQHLGAKQAMLEKLFNNRIINADPEKWLALAKFVGQMRGELKPIDYRHSGRVIINGKEYVSPRASPNKDEEYVKNIYLGNYKTTLERSIKDLTGELEKRAHLAEFDDDSKREEFYDTLVKLSHFPEYDAALSKTNTLPIVVTNLAAAVLAVNALPELWQSHWREYAKSADQILDVFSRHEKNPDAQKAVRNLFDDAIALQTVYGGATDAEYLWYKRTVLKNLIFKSRIINTDPEKWLALAKFVGQMKSEAKPANYDFANEIGAAKNGVRRSILDGSRDIVAEGYKKIHLKNYQEILTLSIHELTGILVNHSHKVEFDDDSKRKEFKESLVKFAQLSEADANRMDVSKRVNTNTPPAANPAQTTKPEK